jgi:hypothetical protein
MTMRLPSKTLAAAVVAAAIPLAGPAAAAPLSQSLALNNADAGTIEQVQYRRWDRGYDGDGYYAYGAAPDGNYAYGAAPGYYVGPRYRGRNWNYGNGSAATGPGSSALCPPDREQSSGYPSWMCR